MAIIENNSISCLKANTIFIIQRYRYKHQMGTSREILRLEFLIGRICREGAQWQSARKQLSIPKGRVEFKNVYLFRYSFSVKADITLLENHLT